MKRTIGGQLTLDALSRLHRPSDRNTVLAAATELRSRGLSLESIARALGCSENAVRGLLGGPACCKTAISAVVNHTAVPPNLEAVADLIDRAEYDLQHGWVDAARDALGRAAALLRRDTCANRLPSLNSKGSTR